MIGGNPSEPGKCKHHLDGSERPPFLLKEGGGFRRVDGKIVNAQTNRRAQSTDGEVKQVRGNAPVSTPSESR